MSRKQEEIAKLKVKFLTYYKKLPLIELAAASIGRDPDTVGAWRSKDRAFSESILQLDAEWSLKQLAGVKSHEWKLERIKRTHFSPRQELTGPNGGEIRLSIEDSVLTRKSSKNSK